MVTTALFVEILVVGAIADIWFALVVFTLSSLDTTTISLLLDHFGKLSYKTCVMTDI